MVRIQKILVPIDFSENSEKAVRYGIEIGRDRNASVSFLHIVNQRIIDAVQELNIRGYKGDFVKAVRKLIQDKENVLKQFVPMERLDGIQAEFLVRKGEASEQIIKAAKEFNIDLIIVGSQGHSALASVLIGSVAQNVVHHAPCPVLIVRPVGRDFIE